MDTRLTVNNISCVRQLTPVFTNLSFTLSAGQALLIEGENGAGKSSLLRLLAGLATPASGNIIWEHSESIHYLGHQNGLKLDLTVRENIQLRYALITRDDVFTQASQHDPCHPIFQTLQLQSLLNKPVRSLSAGQKRRVALAMLWLHPKKIWILDEPLTALDVNSQHFFIDYLYKHLANSGIAIISSHHPIALPDTQHQTLRLPIC